MKSGSLIVVYGSYGYTGQLIVEACKAKQLSLILAGRNEQALALQSESTGYPYEVVETSETEKLVHLLKPAHLVIHCGGPFIFTARRMVEACLQARTHYTDITGEIAVFELLKKYDQQARDSGIIVLPGIGFDVVPTDCMASHLKRRLPEATHLELAFATSGGGASRGTTKTAILGLGEESRIRKDGTIIKVPLHQGMKEINFGSFRSLAARIPWGDISTAYTSTGIPNIEVYMGVNKKIARLISMSRYFNWLLSMRWIKILLLKRFDKISGPTSQNRSKSKSIVKGKVWNEHSIYESRLELADGYTFTAVASVAIAQRILKGNFKTGYQTPSLVYGPDFILEFETISRTDTPS